MIKKEYYGTLKDGTVLYRTYSDTGYYIRKVNTGEIYGDAVDVDSADYSYEETDVLTKFEEDNEQEITNY